MGSIVVTEPSPFDSGDDFDARLKRTRRAARGATSPKNAEPRSMSGLGLGMRIATEMVATVAVGVGIGLLLDSWLETKPWLLILFILMGATAGMLNVYRIATGQRRVAGFEQPEPASKASDKVDPTDRGKS